MMTLKFADTHNMVAFLSKPAESEGFEQIANVKAKTVNGEVQLQALVDGKKKIITESTMRRDLQLEDAEGVDCLPNATIFEQLALIGYEHVSQKLTFYKAFFSPQWKILIHTILQCLSAKTTAWNEFSSTMASAIIFFLDQQLEGMSSHNKFYVTPSHTKKIFRNMRRVGKGFSGRETPLFQTMVKQKPRKPKRNGTQIPQSSGPTEHVVDEAVYKELDDRLMRAATTAFSLEAEQDRTTSSGGPRRQETIGDTTARTRFESISKLSNDLLLVRDNTLRSGKDSLKLNELMELCINLQTRVLYLEKTKITQANEIDSLKRRVKRLKKKMRSNTHGLKRLYMVGLSARVESSRDKEDLESEVAVKDVNISVDEVTLAQALAALKSVKPKVKANVVEGPSVPVSAASIKLAKIEADHELAQRLQAQEQEELSDAEKATLFVQLLEKRRKHFAAKRAEEKRNKPPTQAQQRKIITDLVEGSSKRAGTELEQESIKKQKVDEDKETAELQSLIKVIPDEEEVAIDDVPLATKPPTIVD
ncbi:hypothetical protein Tco_0236779 [Tanacetum coccineum]